MKVISKDRLYEELNERNIPPVAEIQSVCNIFTELYHYSMCCDNGGRVYNNTVKWLKDTRGHFAPRKNTRG